MVLQIFQRLGQLFENPQFDFELANEGVGGEEGFDVLNDVWLDGGVGVEVGVADEFALGEVNDLHFLLDGIVSGVLNVEL